MQYVHMCLHLLLAHFLYGKRQSPICTPWSEKEALHVIP